MLAEELRKYIGNFYPNKLEMMEDIRKDKVWRMFVYPEYIPLELVYRILCFDRYRRSDKAFIYYVKEGHGIRIYKIEAIGG